MNKNEVNLDKLHFPASLLTNNDIIKYRRMGLSYGQIQNDSWIRLVISIISAFLLCLIAVITNKQLFLISCLIIPVITWGVFSLVLHVKYKNFEIHQHFMLDILMSVLAPYLYEISKDNSNNQSSKLFQRILNRRRCQ